MKKEPTKKQVENWGKKFEAAAIKTPTILEEANTLIYGNRQVSYGSVTSNFGRIAKIWSAVLGVDVTPAQVGLCMVGVKMAREVNKPTRDNLVDIAGYAGTLEKLSKGE
jgi:hypothetical protein